MEYSAVDKMVASFIMDGNIYSSWSMDGGEKWTEPWQINDNDGLVVEEYRSSSLGYGIFAIWEEKHDDIDVYFGEVTVPPDTPTINGKTKGKAGEQYEYTISTMHPDGYDVLYYVDWGDDTYEDWIGPTPSGEPIIVEHIWANEDTYDIRVKAKTENGVEGQWATLSVSMPKNKAIKINTLIQRFLENHHNILDILKNLWGS
jgi:hypothetical protein